MDDSVEVGENAEMKNWCSFENCIYPVRVLIFMGNRKRMCENVHFAMVDKNVFSDPMKMDFAANFAKQWCMEFGEEDNSVHSECLSVFSEKNGQRMWIIRIGSFDGSIDDTALVSHECLHAAIGIMEYCGVNEKHPFEALCYLHEAIFKKAIEFMFGRVGMLRKKDDILRENV